MRLLGIDYGSKRVGLALSDDKGMMAFPHSVIPNTQQLFETITELARLNSVETIVLGKSLNYKGEENHIMEGVRTLADKLRTEGLHIEFESELLSSHQAAHFQGKTDMLDAAAASIILQSYIDRIKK